MINIQPFRIPPKLPASQRKTYAIKQHFRPATCAEVECAPWRNGWTSTFDVSTAGVPAARLLRGGVEAGVPAARSLRAGVETGCPARQIG